MARTQILQFHSTPTKNFTTASQQEEQISKYYHHCYYTALHHNQAQCQLQNKKNQGIIDNRIQFVVIDDEVKTRNRDHKEDSFALPNYLPKSNFDATYSHLLRSSLANTTPKTLATSSYFFHSHQHNYCYPRHKEDSEIDFDTKRRQQRAAEFPVSQATCNHSAQIHVRVRATWKEAHILQPNPHKQGAKEKQLSREDDGNNNSNDEQVECVCVGDNWVQPSQNHQKHFCDELQRFHVRASHSLHGEGKRQRTIQQQHNEHGHVDLAHYSNFLVYCSSIFAKYVAFDGFQKNETAKKSAIPDNDRSENNHSLSPSSSITTENNHRQCLSPNRKEYENSFCNKLATSSHCYKNIITCKLSQCEWNIKKKTTICGQSVADTSIGMLLITSPATTTTSTIESNKCRFDCYNNNACCCYQNTKNYKPFICQEKFKSLLSTAEGAINQKSCSNKSNSSATKGRQQHSHHHRSSQLSSSIARAYKQRSRADKNKKQLNIAKQHLLQQETDNIASILPQHTQRDIFQQQQKKQRNLFSYYGDRCNGSVHVEGSRFDKESTNSKYSHRSTSFTSLSTTTTKITSPSKQNVYKTTLRESTISAFIDLQKFARAILPLIIIFNMLPLFYAVASDFDASELRGGPNPEPHPWIPAAAYLEPLPRPTKSPKCDQTFVSRIGGPQNGTFSAPLLHNAKNHSRQCLYTFLAGPGQRVEVIFSTFNLRGSPPDGSAVGELPTCVHEYMDIYTEVQSSDPADLINSPFGGRYCGTIPPRRRISMHRAIAISFFTNKNVSMPDLFEGRYRFKNASEYEIGIPIAGSPCSYTITPSMSINKTGVLISPTYPGAYPKDMSCTYQFLGETNQRVRLEFRDFDLFFGGPHCPFDYVKVYDGPDNSSALIGTYCGQQRNLVLYSSESSLFVHFYTLPRTANTQNRGFKGIYEFSESFVKLDFIRENDGIHIRGSECDQKILSKKESTGFVLSPNYPYPYIPKTVCRYFIYGMQDAQHLERVRLEFSSFNIPKVEHKDKSESNCSDGYLKVYLKGQETADAYDKFDYELCGNETQRVVSDGPRLAMVFSSGELQGRGFKGKYTFETEYKIPGTAAPDGTCSFTYVSNSKKRGELNSPRYPSNYPSETNCSYLFLAESNEQVTIVFDHFKVKADNVNSTAGAYGASACFEDWLEMYVIYRDNNDRFLGRYCGLTAPGPVESPRGAVGLRITLHTDQENVASGFKARYFFETAKTEIGDCGGNFSNEDSGVIQSLNYPANYKSPPKGLASMACNWYISARAGYKLSINFEHFSVEGDPMARGCPAAVLRMWTNVDSDAPPIELCGEKPATEHWHYISIGQSARISFTTTDKTIGAQGFRIVWTEIQDSGPGPPSIGLLCESTYHFQCEIGYCISDKLRCDGVKNCGPGDDSDELHCIMEAPKEDHGVLIIITLFAVSFLICLLCTLCHSKRKRRHHPRQLGLHRNAAHYDSTTSATAGLSSSRRHLQGAGSLSGSLHGINSGTLIIPPAPLPPTSVPPPPHICISGVGIDAGMIVDDGGGLDDDDDDNDDDEDNRDIFINDVQFDEDEINYLNHFEKV